MDNRCIGVFDSGLGGLTCVKQIMKELPDENLIYFGDTGRVPYGTRSAETIIKYSKADIRFLKSFDVKQIVVACGTVSSVALPVLAPEEETPMIGVVEATAMAAYRATKNGKIGIIGTPGTIGSCAYQKRIALENPDVEMISRACPLFVPLVENGHFNTPVAKLVVEEYLSDIRAYGVDTLILGCTHYPLLRDAIAEFMGGDVTLVDAGAELAKELRRELHKEERHSAGRDAEQYRYYVSDNIESFAHLASVFLQSDVKGQVRKIEIERYEE